LVALIVIVIVIVDASGASCRALSCVVAQSIRLVDHRVRP